jgi:hypothetical protein
MAASDKHSVCAMLEGLQYENRIDSPGTHDFDDSDIRRILQPRCAREIRGGV